MQGTSELLDETFLRRLLDELGRESGRFRFEVAPNPCVGAAVLSGRRIVARGFHESWGGPHAEVAALEAAARSRVPRERWDTLVVTLEPCSSLGKTPPCLDALLALARQGGLERVVVGDVDPDPRHRGRALAGLRAAGVEVLELAGAAPLSVVAPHFLRWTSSDRRRRPRPWTIAKWAQTRSGQLTPPEDVGQGRWISSPASLDEVHRLRAGVDAIVTGVSTVLADDPRLGVRPPGDPGRAPVRVVLDSVLRTPVDGRLLAPAAPGEGLGPLHVLCQAGASPARHRELTGAGATVTGLHASEEDHVNLRDVQGWLWERGLERVLLEAGPSLISRYLDLGFVDQIRVYTGNVNGGRGESLGQRLAGLRLEGRMDREVGPDSVLEAFLECRT